MFNLWNILSWIFFGALAGWIASIIMGTNRQQGCFGNIIIGVLGALLGGIVMQLIVGRPILSSWNLTSFIVAVVGACVVLLLTGWYRRRRR